MSTQLPPNQPPKSRLGDPVWELADMFPEQGRWTEDRYLAIKGKRGMEFVDGVLEFLPMPTEFHQIIAAFLYDCVRDSGREVGVALFSGLRVRIRPGKIREPDIVFLLNENRDKRGSACWQGADLAIEIVSDDDPNRDYVDKRSDYAEAGIREYWIVDPRNRSVTQFVLDDTLQKYADSDPKTGDVPIQSIVINKLQLTANEIFNRPEALEQT